MKYFIDTEFIEGPQTKRAFFLPIGKTRATIDLISIGIVCEDGREYYAISKDFNLREAWNRWQHPNDINPIKARRKGFTWINSKPSRPVYWIRDNVLKPIYDELERIEIVNYKGFTDPYYELDLNFTYSTLKRLIKKHGKSNKEIAEEIIKFTSLKAEGFDGTLNPVSVSRKPTPIEFYGYYSDYDWVVFCWLFGKMIDLPKGFPMYCKDLKQDSDRIYNLKKEEYSKGGGRNFIIKLSNHPNYPTQTNEHNALADAKWNMKLNNFLNSL